MLRGRRKKSNGLEKTSRVRTFSSETPNQKDKGILPDRTDRTRHRGEDSALLVKNSINLHPAAIASSSFQNNAIAIDLPDNSCITVASIYRPPHGQINTQENDRLFNQSTKGIAVGDNYAKHPARIKDHSNTNGAKINDHIGSNNIVLLAPLEPTHFF
ncbi:hypothetical protein AVEN_214521-1 [Araneus ventricosus]|uniref:Endonuclease/exonuclease/phosphatase domain-containing protein n=1 Tax=Araneus ventricosus TaxID=182803 RepID=A0A4Y2R9Z1_ARAVE|nr:hypothetical protein AVEN_214521-1 [Araneus ventricosus]